MKHINKNILYLIGAVILIVLAYLIYVGSNNLLRQQAVTTPLTTPPSPTTPFSVTNQIKLSEIEVNPNSTPYQEGSYSIESRKLVFTSKDGAKTTIDTGNEPVNDFDINKDSILITTGILYTSDQSYFLIKPGSTKAIRIDTGKMKPIVSISASPDGTSVLILGNYNIKTYTANLYLYNTNNNLSTPLFTGLIKNFVKTINTEFAILGNEIDKQEPNLTFDILKYPTKEYVAKGLQSARETICSNSNSVIFYDYLGKNIKVVNFVARGISQIAFTVSPPYPQILCNDSNLYVISSQKQIISTQRINLSNQQDKKTSEIKITADQTLVLSYLIDNSLVYKVYDRAKGTYSLAVMTAP